MVPFRVSMTLTCLLLFYAAFAAAQTIADKATLGEVGQASAEVSTEELRQILANGSAIVLDVRPYMEFATSHIPGAIKVSAKPEVEMSLYVSDVAEINRLLKGKKDTPLIFYGNGPFCGKSKRLAEELIEAGFSNVRRYQLGIPVWRALGGATQIEPEGIQYVIQNDKTAVIIDVRSVEEFTKESAPLAKGISYSRVEPGKNVGELRAAKNDGRLPMLDHNTRIIVFGASGADAKAIAEKTTQEAFHNVSYFNGTAAEFLTLLRP